MVDLHKHNEETYQKIVSMFAENERICAAQPAGTAFACLCEAVFVRLSVQLGFL